MCAAANSSIQPIAALEALGEPLASYEDALAFLDGLDISAMKLGLSRVMSLLETFDNPQDALPMVHIAGTNGKGSVTAMLSSVLLASGFRVGTFISPHLVHLRERIAINGMPILPDEFLFEVNHLRAQLALLQCPREDWPTYFEALNVIAYLYFQRKAVDITVFETGLGGRLDSTNVVRQPNLTVITTIGMDHTAHLGNTLAAIAGEKAGILKTGVPLVLGPSIPKDALAVIQARAQLLEVPVHPVRLEGWTVAREQSCLLKGLKIENAALGEQFALSLLAPYQLGNAVIVLECVQALRQQGFAITVAQVAKGLRATRWPVRFQWFEQERLLLDGSHNADGFAALVDAMALYFPTSPSLWLISLRNNRPAALLMQCLAAIDPHPAGLVITHAEPVHLYHELKTLEAAVFQQFPGQVFPVRLAETPVKALQDLRTLKAQYDAPDQPVSIVTGSLYTAGAILAELDKILP